MTGTWMQTFAQGWVLTGLTSSALVLGGVHFAAGIPMLLLTLLGGSFADRYDKRLILHGALLTQMLLAAGTGWLLATEQIAIWHIFVAAIILGITTAFEVPAVTAFVPELVAKEQMANAIAIDRSVFHATRLIGPALAGYLVGKVGVSSAYYLNAFSYFALILAILTIAPRKRGSLAEEEKRKGAIHEGLLYVKEDEPTRIMVLLMAAMTCFASPFLMITMPLYARTTLGLGPDRMGLLMAISGVGSFAGSIGLLSLTHRARMPVLRLAAASATIALFGLAWAPSFNAAAVSVVMLTLGLSTAFGLANIVIQERAPDYIRGRVSSVAGLSFFGILPFSGLLNTAVADLIGIRAGLAAGAVCYGLCAVLLLGRTQIFATASPVSTEAPETEAA